MVPSGTPKTLAALNPEYTTPIIFPRFLGRVNMAVKANTFTIISEAAADDRMRPITSIVKLGAKAIIALPIMNISNVHNSTNLALKR